MGPYIHAGGACGGIFGQGVGGAVDYFDVDLFHLTKIGESNKV